MRSSHRLYGRGGELTILDALLARLTAGHGGTLVLTAPPGFGRSALLRHAADGWGDGPVLYAAAAPGERLLPFSGLHALLCSGESHGRSVAPVPDVLRAGLAPTALLDLLTDLGSREPLLVCVDDAHEWDPRSRDALAFAVRRLPQDRRVGVLLTAAEQEPGSGAFAGLPALRLGPLDDAASRSLLGQLTDGRSTAAVVEELRREGAGNPRLLTALVERLSHAELTGRQPLPEPLSGGEELMRAYASRVRELPPETRTLLLLAAAAEEHEPEGAGADAILLRRAGQLAGIDPGRLGPAETSGAVRSGGGRVRFSHPLLRRAVLSSASIAHRRAVHQLLATVLDGPHRTLPRLVQRACAASGYDPALADSLVRAAVPPRPHADRAAALTRAAALSTDEALRSARFAAAAEHAWLAGEPGRARILLARVRAVPEPGRSHYVRGQLALYDGPAADAREALLTAAALLAPRDPARTVTALLGAAEAAWAMGDAPAYLDAMSRIRPHGAEPSLAQYCAGMHAVLVGRTSEGHALLRDCFESAARTGDAAELLRAGMSALVLGEVEAACRAGARALAAVRAHGPDVLLPQVLEHLAYGELRAGRHARARAHAREGLCAAERSGQRNVAGHLHAVLALAASVEGESALCAEHAEAAAAAAQPHGLAQAATLAAWAVARAELADGRSAEAAARLFPLVSPGPRRGHFATRMLAVPCFVEAAVLAGRASEAHRAVEEFALWTSRTADPQAPAQLARCRALLASGDEAGARWEEALAHHDRAAGDFERARTQLLYGHWLRRQRRTREARTPLRDALVGFERCGARLWTGRVRGELRAAGESVAGAGPGTGLPDLLLLTPQQQRIARCVAEGATNREVARRLSLSTRTVDHHLRNVFAALGVRSRTELARLLDHDDPNPAPL